MAYATYPPTLPAPRQSGYTEARTQNIIRTTFMNGQIKQRFINTGAPVSVNVSFSFSDKQYGEFLYFVNSKILAYSRKKLTFTLIILLNP